MEVEDEIPIEVRIQVLFDSGVKKPKTLLQKLSPFTDMSLRTMQRKVDKLENGESIKRKQYQRSPSVMDEEMQNQIKEIVQREDIFTIPDIQKAGQIKASKNAIWQFLNREGYVYKKAEEKPLLTSKHIQMRLDFCEKYKGKKALLNQGLFCDESTFYCHSQPQYKWTNEQSSYKTFQPKYPYKVQVWGGICRFGTATLKIFDGNMNWEVYKSIVENELNLSAKRLFGRKKWMLIEDNDPKHVCKIVDESRQKLQIIRLNEWPSCSPDLNPIENIWGWLKKQVEKDQAKTKEELIDSIRRNWSLISVEFLEPYIESFNNRLQDVIDNEGKHINY